MRLVNIDHVASDSILARAVRSANGRVLLNQGVTLTAQYLKRLKLLGFDMLFIKDDRFQDIEINYAITDKTKEIALDAVRIVTTALEKDKNINVNYDSVHFGVMKILDDLLYSSDVLCNLSDINGYDEYTYHHSVNTTVLALILGKAKGYSQRRLLELGMGVLMHDIGKTVVPKDILNREGPLSPEEFEEVKKHTSYGYDFLRKNHDFSANSAHVALQHHEKWAGGGYPRGLKGPDIHEYGRITAVADVYDALTSKRPYRAAMDSNLAYEYVVSQSGTHFDPEVISIFARSVLVYPTGTGVVLSNGLRGNVIKQNKYLPNRPVVRVISDGDRPLDQFFEVDLSEQVSLRISKVENR